MATDIPRARQIVNTVRTRLLRDGMTVEASELQAALDLMTRKQRFKNDRVVAAKVTPDIIRRVKAMKVASPALTHREIGAYFNIDGGRVSEILNGLRTECEPSMMGDASVD